MTPSGRAFTLAAAALILLRWLAADWGGAWWSINHLHYLTPGFALIILTPGILCLIFPYLFKAGPRGWNSTGRAAPAWLAGVLFLVLVKFYPHVGTPLLGDGLDRIEAVLAGYGGLQGQPAPLDVLIHVWAFKLLSWPGRTTWLQAWQMWQTTSLLTAPFAAAALWKLAALRSENRGQRWFLFTTVIGAGTLVFYLGYVENYVILTAALYGYLLLLELHRRGRAPRWTLALAQLILIGLHFFMVLLLPATGLALHRAGKLHLKRTWIAGGAVLLAAFGALLLHLLREYYHGVAAIFVSPSQLFGAYHLIGFAGQQLLASPALPLLIPLAAGRRNHPDDLVGTFLGAASLTFLLFFFLLRPVIGPAADWDLFALPALLYTPWLALRVVERLKTGSAVRAAAFAVIGLTLASTIPWTQVNTLDNVAVQRFKDLMEWEAPYNPWAASYGYLRLGKYRARRPWIINDPEITGSFLRAVEINPRSATVRKQAAELLKARGEKEEAARQLSMNHLLLGEYHEQKGDPERAMREYREAYALDAGNLEALQNLIRLFAGPLQDPQQAEFYRRALERAEADGATGLSPP